MLRDRLVVGNNKDNIQQCLLSESSIMFNKALQIAKELETEKETAHDVKIESDSCVNKMLGNKRQSLFILTLVNKLT